MSNRSAERPNTPTDSIAQSEAGLCGSAILDQQEVFARVSAIVSPGDFLDADYGAMFAALQTLDDAGKPLHDVTVLQPELRRLGVAEDLASSAALMRLINQTIHAGHAVYYAEAIAEAASLRRLQGIASELQRRATEHDADAAEIRHWLEGQLAKLDRTQPHDLRLIGDVAAAAIASVDAAADAPTRPGLMTGIDCLDQVAGAIMPGEVVIVAARPGNGKTSLATQIAEHNSRRGRQSLMVSLEMRGTELALRMLCPLAEIDSRDLRSSRIDQQARQRLRGAKESLDGLSLRIWSPPTATLAEIRGVARYAKATTGLQLLVVDYLGLVRPSPDEKRLQRYEQVSAVSAGLKALAKELDVVVLALCQLNREADGMEPKLSHLRESGSIEQDADAVWLIHHPPGNGGAANGSAYALGCSLILGKHRHGETGRVSLLWHPSETRFSSPTSF